MVIQIKAFWGRRGLVQKLALIGIPAAVIVGIAALSVLGSTLVPVFDASIRDKGDRNRIITRINQEDVKTTVSPTGVVMVADEATARRMRSILIREDLIPMETDPWVIFDRAHCFADIERDERLRKAAVTQDATNLITALDDVDTAYVNIVWPKITLFASEQEPVTASVVITPKPGSDITQNRKKIESIQNTLKFAVEGLKDENIVIVDQNGLVLNDFEGLAAPDGFEAGKTVARFEIARKLKEMGLSTEQIVESTGLSREEVEGGSRVIFEQLNP